MLPIVIKEGIIVLLAGAMFLVGGFSNIFKHDQQEIYTRIANPEVYQIIIDSGNEELLVEFDPTGNPKKEVTTRFSFQNKANRDESEIFDNKDTLKYIRDNLNNVQRKKFNEAIKTFMIPRNQEQLEQAKKLVEKHSKEDD